MEIILILKRNRRVENRTQPPPAGSCFKLPVYRLSWWGIHSREKNQKKTTIVPWAAMGFNFVNECIPKYRILFHVPSDSRNFPTSVFGSNRTCRHASINFVSFHHLFHLIQLYCCGGGGDALPKGIISVDCGVRRLVVWSTL